jgi:hypothetical protein
VSAQRPIREKRKGEFIFVLRIVIVKLVVLDRIDKTERWGSTRVLCHCKDMGDSFAPPKKGSIAELLISLFFRETVCIDDRRVVCD